MTLLAAAGGVGAAVAGVNAQEPALPEGIGVIETAPNGLTECGPSEVGGVPEGLEAALTFQIVPEESAARYRVNEELVATGPTTAVGETNAIIGQILFGEDGLPIACSRFDVDLRTLTSDSTRRDNYLYTNTLETETYPLATFVLRAVDGLEEPLAEGEEASFVMVGDLSMHGVTRLVSWETTATLEGEALVGAAATTFQMPDFEIVPPSVPVVASLEETVRLEVDLTAQAAA